MKVGKKLKLLRKERKLTLKELSDKSGVAIATLSRMEHDIMTGTIESHINICKSLGVNLADFYRELENESKTISFIKQKEKPDSIHHQKQASIELLTSRIMSKKMMPVLLHVSKNGTSVKEENKPGSEKFIYIFEGSLTAHIGSQSHKLLKGDSLYFDASLPHYFANEGHTDASALYVLTPPEF